MRILVACEESQAVTKELRALGHEAYSADIQECSGGHPEWHIKGDVLPLLNGRTTFYTQDIVPHMVSGKWDMIIAHPPCTFLSNAGARHLYPGGILNKERYQNGMDAKKLFDEIWSADCEKIAIENPIPSTVFGLPPYTQIIQPCEHGHPFTKRTCLWLKGLPKLNPTQIIEKTQSTKIPGNWFNKGGKERQKNRSKTFPGIAKAMATQWTKGESE